MCILVCGTPKKIIRLERWSLCTVDVRNKKPLLFLGEPACWFSLLVQLAEPNRLVTHGGKKLVRFKG